MTVLIFIAVLLVLILVHEFGHFIFAKLFKVRVDEFGIGYPPRALKIAKIGETEYTLNWLPFGGFVRLLGESKEELEDLDEKEKEKSLAYKKPWQKIIILAAGAAFNFLFAWAVFSYVYYSGTPVFWDKEYVQNSELKIVGTVDSSPAYVAGLQSGDVILDLHLKSDTEKKPQLLSPAHVAKFISEHPGEEIIIKYKDAESGEVKEVSLIPSQGIIKDEPSRAAVGMQMTLVSHKKYSLFESVILGFKTSVDVAKAVFLGFIELVKGALSFDINLKQVAGPVGIAGMVGKAYDIGFAYLLYFTALISVNLAVINLLPIPALDGGRIVFALYEWITRRQAPKMLEDGLNFVGFVFLIVLMLLITYHDILKLFSK